ncbi:hypothetical protein LR48_Vigan04g096800 [Vigna angularis]|uniref:Uncharacterized protein n=1 Tax=Phaseolus angularis TaxID=3914 RepID=A0A0L9UCW6_PHAAN|nr:hypothetical protein LR48_Vigan04g096800 [Vigna angularis]
MKEEDEDNEEKLVHQDSVLDNNELEPSKPGKFKNRLWVMKAIKANGDLEIEAPYSRRFKLVARKMLRLCWLYDASPGLQCMSLDEFNTHMSWPRDQARASGGGDKSPKRMMRKIQMPLRGVMTTSPDAARSGFSYVFVIFMHV